MKGVIVICMQEMVIKKFGENKWKVILEKAGLNRNSRFLPASDIEDEIVLQVVDSMCSILKISLEQAADAFGDYWINVYAPRVYSVYFKKIKSAKEFFIKLDYIHKTITSLMANARPPKFDYEWKDSNTVIITYKSHRNLFEFFIGLAKGVRNHFKDNFKIIILGKNRAEIIFSK